jgi:hypothetical protein
MSTREASKSTREERNPKDRLYAARKNPFRKVEFDPSLVLTRDEAIADIVEQWHAKYETTEEEAASELDGGYAHDFEELSEPNYKKYAAFRRKIVTSAKTAASVKTGGKNGTRRTRKDKK